jgi:putative ABC transport system ATP-binding protein
MSAQRFAGSENVHCVVELTNVCKNYAEGESTVHALRNVTLRVRCGERVAVMGQSGSGKSTLLNLVCGLDEPSSGSIKIDGLELANMSDDERTLARREKIGMIFQTFNLLPTLSALENAAFPLRLQGVSRHDAERRASELLERVRLKARSCHLPDELSGGERQRVAIARALVFNPPLLLADEPTGNLDSATGDEILCLLDDLHREFGTTMLMVTHNPDAAERCHRVLTLRDGVFVHEEGAPEEPAGPR